MSNSLHSLRHLGAELATIAYRKDKPETWESRLISGNLNWFRSRTDDAVMCSRKNNDTVYISIAGTQNKLIEWVWNFSFLRVEFDHFGKAHRGFVRNAHELFAMLWDAGLSDFDGKIIIAGHSRGGPLGLLIALKLAYLNKNVRLLTFGSPRVGNEAFHESCKKLLFDNVLNYVNPLDLVTKMPWWSDRFGASKEVAKIPSDARGAYHTMKAYLRRL